MKVLHIGKFYPPVCGGIEYFLRDLVEEQRRQEADVKVICHDADRKTTSSAAADTTGEIIRVPILGTLAYAPIAPSFPLRLVTLLKNFQPDVLHVHLPNPSAFWLLGMSNLPPLIIHWHADVITANGQAGLQLLYPGYRIFEKRLLIRATSIIVTSPDYLASSLPLKPFRAKCTVIPLGISPERMTSFQSDRQKTDSELNGHPCTDDGQLRTSALELCQGVDHSFRPSQSAAKNIVFSVGRFTYYKGFEFLLQAAQRIPQASFIIAGSGPKLKSIETLRHKLGLANRVCLPGHLTDEQIHLLLAASNLFCLPSIERTEAFGMVLLEAMHYGKPVISTNVAGSGMQFVNRDGVTGFSVEPSNPEHLAHAILTVLDDSPLQRAMGQQGASRVKSAFHISRIAEDIFTTYHRAGIVDPIERPV